MFDLYTHATPNGYKATIALEELGLPYNAHPIDVRQGINDPKLLAMNPNAKIPILMDNDAGISVYESGAILLYLAKSSGKLFPADTDLAGYSDGLQKLFFASSWMGPMFGQRVIYSFFTEEAVPHALTRYEREAKRATGVAQDMLGDQDFFLASGFSIVDIAIFGWIHVASLMGDVPADEFPKLTGWIERMKARPAVAKGITIPMSREDAPIPPRKTLPEA